MIHRPFRYPWHQLSIAKFRVHSFARNGQLSIQTVLSCVVSEPLFCRDVEVWAGDKLEHCVPLHNTMSRRGQGGWEVWPFDVGEPISTGYPRVLCPKETLITFELPHRIKRPIYQNESSLRIYFLTEILFCCFTFFVELQAYITSNHN